MKERDSLALFLHYKKRGGTGVPVFWRLSVECQREETRIGERESKNAYGLF